MRIIGNSYSTFYAQNNSRVDKNAETKSVLDNALDKAEKELSTEEYLNTVGFVWKSQSIINFRKNGDVRIKDYNDKLAKSSVIEQKKSINDMIDILKSNSIQKGYYMGQAESEAHFQARKNQAIDYLSGLLQDIKV
ncbi:hypothetical protein [Campylobacter sp. US33a]|uniref:hypothetical protein n=1 Tax=Campylobacter sp. US33a TaxID=2498120 RepID=UPI001067300D|nr:hypothetical protein [Campylobacter sp. US33a]TEY04073.1 hypothetical protein ELQ16_02195 [Campylobacter sp. US33a]